MKRPSFQFYPGDWQRDAALRICSVGARGLWLEMICIMHQAEPYGHLVINGKPVEASALARMVGATTKEVIAWLSELEDAGVYDRENGVIVSRRMVRDEKTRKARAEGGNAGAEHGIKGAEHGNKGGRPSNKKGGLETPLKTPLSGETEPPLNPPPSSSVSSSPSVSEDLSQELTTFTPETPTQDLLPVDQPKKNLGTTRAREANAVPISAETWTAYAAEYGRRYGVDPVRNATVNAQLTAFVKRLGAEEAPQVAAFYVRHNKAFYVSRQHATGPLLQDAEGLRTEWATGRMVTNTEAMQQDRKQNTVNAFAPLLAEAQAREANGKH